MLGIRYQQGWFLLRAVWMHLFPTSPLPSGGLLAIFGGHWLVEASSQPLLSSSRGVLPVCSHSSFCTCLSPDFPFF